MRKSCSLGGVCARSGVAGPASTASATMAVDKAAKRHLMAIPDDLPNA
jgi:hypothetical protein